MTEEYVRNKIKEALSVTSGDRRDAQKLLITWAVRDQPLLLGLAKPHLKAIITARIEHALTPTKKKDEGEKEARFSKHEIDEMIASRPLHEKRSPVVPPPKSSSRQASMMHHLADAFKKRKK